MVKRVILIVLDSVGVGELPDAAAYGDAGANTLGNLSRAVGGLAVPHLERMGLGKIIPVEGVSAGEQASAAYGKMAEKSAGKDTTTGHWELAGHILDVPFPTYGQGFPKEIIDAFTQRIGRQVLGNEVASGTEIIQRLGEKHCETGFPIVYTSADSVFQIAAHEEIIPLETLYDYCKMARAILQPPHAVGRVIARPFLGSPGNFYRTANRHDYSLEPPYPTLLDKLYNAKLPVIGIGKIHDIYTGRGITHSMATVDNEDGVDKILQAMRQFERGLIFTNLVEFDMKFGHRNDPRGYADALEAFDQRLPQILDGLTKDDVLIITADHRCDPTYPTTDHTREYVPLLVAGAAVKENLSLGIRETFADISATILTLFQLENELAGTDMSGLFLKE